MGGILERVRRPPLKRPFSDADLLAYSDEHVSYEVWMFFEMVSALSTPTARPSWNPTTTLPTSASTTAPTVVFSNPSLGIPNNHAIATINALTESFTTHLRNLIDFLFEPPDKTDVAAADFCAPGSWNPGLTPTLKQAKRRVNKELAHLTTGRTSGSSHRQWDVVALAGELKPVLQDFIAKADKAKLSPRVATAIP
jgi:hypothetical protein